MRKLFTEWVLQIQLTEEAYTKKIYLYNNSVFLSFNYTNTLEKLYKVQAKNILYIHNKATNNKSTLILGHSRNPISIKSLNPVINNDYADIDVRVWEANEIIDNYFNSTYKKTQEIIRKNNHFFKSLKRVKNVLVLGHSMSKVDFPYFKKIIDCIDKEKTRWKISVRNPEDLESRKDSVKELGINLNLVEFDSIMNFDLRQFVSVPKTQTV